MSVKQYLYSKCRKKTKSISGLTRHVNVCTKILSQTAFLPIYYKLYNNNKDILDKSLEDRSQLLDNSNYNIKDVIQILTKKISWNELLAIKSLLLLGEK